MVLKADFLKPISLYK